MNFDRCFVCTGRQSLEQEQPYKWLDPGVACADHARLAVLPSGQSVSAYTDPPGAKYPLEGPHLSFILNPVSIEGTRGWIEFVAGGAIVVEEIFPSKTYFQFTVQHYPKCVDGLYSLYRNYRSTPNIVRMIRRLGRYNAMLDDMIDTWAFQRGVEIELEKRRVGFPKDSDQLVRVLESVDLKYSWQNWWRWVFSDIEAVLVKIGEKRFSHLGATSN